MGKVMMTITVDWEGEKLILADLSAMQRLHKQLQIYEVALQKPIPITHFICPAYFTRTDTPNLRKELVNQILQSGAIGPNDEIAAHVHGWKSLVIEAGIPSANVMIAPIGGPANSTPPVETLKYTGPDIGYTVPFGAYSQPQIVAILSKTIDLLKQCFQVDVVSFRCGMWVTCDPIFNAIRATQLKYEASALPFGYMNIITQIVPNLVSFANMILWNVTIWGNTATTGANPAYTQNIQSFAQYNTGILGMGNPQISQPKKIGGILEIPDTGALLPITNLNLMKAHLDQAFTLAKTSLNDIYISIGFHQEDCSAGAFFGNETYPLDAREEAPNSRIDAIWLAVNYAISQAKAQGVGLEFLKIREVG